ncbi:glycosyltransferase family 2 protein [Mycobacterium sp. 29Ha]|uniref:glycosyltransferase family 2 protein n=1 Tax=Mycobacterium sp. 29Ha TaxID=2939268 RepID=UPI003977D26A
MTSAITNGNGTTAHSAPIRSPLTKPHNAALQATTVSLVIPVRNEARNIAWVLEQIADDVHEIILVDGESTDATLITAMRYRPDIRVVPQEGTGKGSALRTGFLAATGDVIVMMDADGSMSPQEIRHYVHSWPTATTSSRARGSWAAAGRWTSHLSAGSGTDSCWSFSTPSTTPSSPTCATASVRSIAVISIISR